MTAKVSGKTATRLRTPAQMSQAVTPEASRPLRTNPNLLCYFQLHLLISRGPLTSSH